MIRRALLAACVAGIAGCASAPTPKSAVPEPVDPATAVTLHLYRADTGYIGAAVDQYVYVDGFRVGRLNRLESFELKVAPGEREVVIQPHTLGIPDGKQVKLTIRPQARQDVYLRYALAVSSIFAVGRTATVNFDVGLQEVTESDWAARR